MTIITYYFDGDNGQDSNAGTSEALPKRTLSNTAAFRTIPAAGDITYIKFKRGTTVQLTGNLAINSAAGALVYTSYGDPGAAQPIVQWSGGDWSWGSTTTATDRGSITWQDLTIDVNGYTNGPYCNRNTLAVYLLDCVLKNGLTLAKISGNGFGRILRNVFQNVNAGAGAALYCSEGISDTHPGMGGYEIAYNTFLNINGQDAISFHDSSAVVLSGNWVHHNIVESGTENALDIAASQYVGLIVTDNVFCSRPKGSSYVIGCSNGEPTSNMVFARNIVDNSSGTGLACAQFTGDNNKIFSNIFVNNATVSTPTVVFGSTATNQTVYNNLFVGTSGTIRELVQLPAGSTGVLRNNIFDTKISGAGRYIISDTTAAAWTYATNDVYFPNLSDGTPFYYNGAARSYAFWLASVETTSLNVDPKLNNYQYTNTALDNTATFSGYYQDKNGRYFSSTPSYGPFEKYESRG